MYSPTQPHTQSAVGRWTCMSMPRMVTEPELDLATLDRVERRVLWLATSIVHHANRVRTTSSGVKVGGHQASSASMASIMTALYFHHLRAPDRVSVKPHAAPVLHAIEYLLGWLDRRRTARRDVRGGRLARADSQVRAQAERGAGPRRSHHRDAERGVPAPAA